MIRHLYIRDFILIKELTLDCREGFTTITGETGAGKSVLIGAVDLILGGRSDAKKIRSGATKSIIEAECDISEIEELHAIFQDHDLDYAPITLLRRELTHKGSRAFINDTPVSTALLKQVGSYLVDIHSQHHNMLIGSSDYQRSLLDIFAGNDKTLQEYKEAYARFMEAHRRYEEEKQLLSKQKEEEDYLRFQCQQLQSANPHLGEIKELENKIQRAEATREITEAFGALARLSESSNSDLPSPSESIAQVMRQLSRLVSFDPKSKEAYDRLDSLQIELADLSRLAVDVIDDTELNPSEQARLEERYDLLQSLLHKHHLNSEAELLNLQKALESRLDKIERSDEYLQRLLETAKGHFKEAQKIAIQLHAERDNVAKHLIPQLQNLMDELGIVGATFQIAFYKTQNLTPTGIDKVDFLLATNKSRDLSPIREIASGGEIARFMLALKTILAEKKTLPTIIFDEIDTGVSGYIAERLGKVMLRLSRNTQVFSITHLPQIAALGTQQLVVAKKEEANEYFTNITYLTDEERVQHLAMMLSGTEKTPEAIANAKRLLFPTPKEIIQNERE